ncbi:MAG TPA: hypothetical protein VJM15_03770 [Sphingomicrobium sp.]|nr:hypothetical protein [Sphingomicrobium sp.]
MRWFNLWMTGTALIAASPSLAQEHDHRSGHPSTPTVAPKANIREQSPPPPPPTAGAPSRFLLVFAGDDWRVKPWSEDFFVTFDLATGKPVATLPIGHSGSMPHHTEYVLPAPGQLLWANAHHAEEILLLDWAKPDAPQIVKRLKAPAPFRFPHDFKRLSDGAMMVGFLRSEGPSPEAGDDTMPGNHGGIAEYRADGTFVRASSAAVAGLEHPVRPYSFIEIDGGRRLVTTSAAMMEKSSADVVQIWRRSDLKLLHTLVAPPGVGAGRKTVPEAAGSPFSAKIMQDGSILVSTYGCGFYRLTGAEGDHPKLTHVLTVSPEAEAEKRGSCGVPTLVGKWWIHPIGKEGRVATFDVSDPLHPRQVASLAIAEGFSPHWTAKDPRSDRIVVGAEAGMEEAMVILRLDEATGALRFDERLADEKGRKGFLDFTREEWPHGRTGPAWGHAALFVP